MVRKCMRRHVDLGIDTTTKDAFFYLLKINTKTPVWHRILLISIKMATLTWSSRNEAITGGRALFSLLGLVIVVNALTQLDDPIPIELQRRPGPDLTVSVTEDYDILRCPGSLLVILVVLEADRSAGRI
jgi:hypothetical protein